MTKKVLFVINGARNFITHRLPTVQGFIDNGYEVSVALPSTESADDLLRKLEFGISAYSIPFARKSINPLRELSTIFSVCRIMKQVKPDLVFNVALKSSLYGTIAGRMTKTPNVISLFTGLGYLFTTDSPLMKRLRYWVERFLKMAFSPKSFKAIFQNSDDQQLFLDKEIIDKDRITLIRGSGVDVEHYSPQPEPEGKPVVLLASRMLKHKGIQEFVDAAKQLKQKNIQAKFVLVGGADPDNPASISECQLAAWEKEGIVEWWKYQDDMRAVLKKAHIVCLPSYYREGLPKVLLEAASCQKALITTDVPGCREVVKDGVNGLLAPAKNSDVLAKAIERLVNDNELRQQLAKAARESAEKEFAKEIVVEQTLAFCLG